LKTLLFINFLISDIKPIISVTTGIAPNGEGDASNCATFAIRIATLSITLHLRWMAFVDFAFSLKRQIYTPDFLILSISILI